MIQTRILQANGVDFHCLVAGEGPLVLCLHGFPDHAESFRPLMIRLANAGYRVVAPNMRGYWPTSAAPDGCYQAWATGDDALALIRILCEGKAVLVGHDWGAVAAYAAARTEPELISHLVTLSVPDAPQVGRALLLDPDQQRLSWYMFYFQLELAEGALSLDNFALIDRLWSDWSPGLARDPHAVAALKSMLRQPGVAFAVLEYYRQAFARPGRPAAWEERMRLLDGPICVPTLYLHGRDDGCMRAGLDSGMAGSFPAGLQTALIEGAGHFLQLERPDDIARRIASFISNEPTTREKRT